MGRTMRPRRGGPFVALLVVAAASCGVTEATVDNPGTGQPSPLVTPAEGAHAAEPIPPPEPTPPPGPSSPPEPTPSPGPTSPTPPGAPSPPEPTTESSPDSGQARHERPNWLGTRELPDRGDGIAAPVDTPPELQDRRFSPPDSSPIANEFHAEVVQVPGDVVARSTWTEQCPVRVADLRYLTMSFWGFDDQTYRGEMIVHESVADDIVQVFSRLYDARFPIEEMRIVAAGELDTPPTGDGNNTTAFVCRPTTQGASWSQHAYGLAVDVNPFHNPYLRDDTVLPELASAYLDRTDHRPGMIQPGDEVTRTFAEIGWAWGGEWRTLKDWMHFSQSGR